MPRGVPIQPDEIQHMLDLYTDCRKRGMAIMEAYKRVGALLGRDPKVVGVTIARLRPTTDLGKMYLRAKSFRLVKRLVAKASPAEIIDILQRPSIGVLDPVKKIDGGGGGGFFMSVNVESCGAVKVGAMQAQAPQPQLEAHNAEDDGANFDPFSEVIDIEGVVEHENGDAECRPDGAETQGRSETAIEKVRRQLAERRQNSGA